MPPLNNSKRKRWLFAVDTEDSMKLTALIEREGDEYVSHCPELDIASQGKSIEEARENLKEALQLFFETASAEEIKDRLHSELFITRVDVTIA
jgi:predicted RNase H-like HicB family nuclease